MDTRTGKKGCILDKFRVRERGGAHSMGKNSGQHAIAHFIVQTDALNRPIKWFRGIISNIFKHTAVPEFGRKISILTRKTRTFLTIEMPTK